MKLGIHRTDFPVNGYFPIFVFMGFLGTAMGMGWSHVGLALCLTCGVTAGGALFGFLFGIPRVLQRNGKNMENYQDRGAASNTNLEQVSDWLTAIIIGASLVQLREIGAGLDWLSIKVAVELSEGKIAVTPPVNGYALAYFAILYFFIGGFIFTYLFTRINLVTMFSEIEKLLDDSKKEAKNLRNVNVSVLGQLEKTLSKATLPTESKVDMLEGDQNKGKFGGKRSVNGRTLSATITPLGAGSDYCRVDLRVTGSQTSPLVGMVTFHLHETFKPLDQVEIEPVMNQASYTLFAYGAFTVGAEADNGKTKLELDLADPDLRGPADWRAR